MDRKAKQGFGDGQGTRVGAPDNSRIAPSEHSDSLPDRPARQTGVGGEAMEGTPETTTGRERQHRSGYGGKGGEPNTSAHLRKPEE